MMFLIVLTGFVMYKTKMLSEAGIKRNVGAFA